MRLLFVGDVVGSPGRKVLIEYVPVLRKQLGLDFVIVNGENAAAGRGLTLRIVEDFFSAGVDVITNGNHVWDKKEFLPVLDQESRVLRPLNYPPGCPGNGVARISKGGKSLVVVSLQGRVFMPNIDCPFRAIDDLLASLDGDVPVFVDFHAEATSEKKVMGYYLDGRVAAMVGTHTHVQTADEEIMPQGMAYITDVGMTGSFYSSIGMTYESVLPNFLTGLPTYFEVASDDVRMNCVVVDIDDETGIALDIRRLTVKDGETF